MRRRSALGFVFAVCAVYSSQSLAQASITKTGVGLKSTSDCDAVCAMQKKLDQLTSRIDADEKENAKLKSALEQDEKRITTSALSVVGLESNVKDLNTRTAKIADIEVKLSRLDILQQQLTAQGAQLSEYSSRFIALETTAQDYKIHTHALPAGFGSIVQDGRNIVTVSTPKVFGKSTSGPEHH